MKKLLLLAALCGATIANAATTVPVQILNPAGSTSGQAVVSTGPTTPPTWGNTTASGLVAQAANTVVANTTSSSHTPTAASIPSCSATNSALQYTSGTGFGCTTTSAVLGANTFTAAQTIGFGGVVSLSLNDSGGTNQARINFQSGGNNSWGLVNTSSTNAFAINWYTAGTLNGAVFTISPSTGVVTMGNGVTGTPISGSTGSFTTLAASSTVSGTGFSSYLAAPPCIGCTTPGAGAFTTLSASGTVSGAGFTSLLSPYATLASPTFTGTPAAPTAATGTSTTQLATTAFVANTFAAPPTAGYGSTTPRPVAATTISATGLITPTSTIGIAGTTTNDSPATGSVGEVIPNSTAGVALTSGTAANCSSETITAGNWLVYGLSSFVPGGATTATQIATGIGTGSATLPTLNTALNATLAASSTNSLATLPVLLKLAVPTAVFLVGQSTFSGSTMTCTGNIFALRIR